MSNATQPPPAAPAGRLVVPPGARSTGDRAARALARAGTGAAVLVPVALIAVLACQSATAPGGPGEGLGRLLAWTLCAATAAVAAGLPVGVGAALFAARFAPRRARRALGTVIDLLAAVPAVAYLLLAQGLVNPAGGDVDRAVLAGLVLMAAIVPTIASLSHGVFAQVPFGRMEASLALGATRWEMVRQVVLPFSARTLRSTAALALSRALSEALTLAALFGGVRPDRLTWPGDGSRSGLWRLLLSGGGLGPFALAAFAVAFAVLAAGLAARALTARRPRGRPRRERAGRPDSAGRGVGAPLAGGRLPGWSGAVLAPACLLVVVLLEALAGAAGLTGTLVGWAFAYLLAHLLVVWAVEGSRSAADTGCRDLCAVAFALTVLPLVSLLVRAVLGAVASPAVFSSAPVLTAVGGTLATIAAATVVSVPVGLACAVWSTEYAGRRGARVVASLADAAVSVPPLTAGLGALAFFGLLAGPAQVPGRAAAGVALCALMIPYIVRGATQMLDLVPPALREQALALGAATWSVILRVQLPTASAGLVQAVVLALSRAVGAASLMLVVSGSAPGPTPGSLPGWIVDRFASGADGLWAGVAWLVVIVVALELAGRVIPARHGPRNNP